VVTSKGCQQEMWHHMHLGATCLEELTSSSQPLVS
jgi:hypothetical protein